MVAANNSKIIHFQMKIHFRFTHHRNMSVNKNTDLNTLNNCSDFLVTFINQKSFK